MEDPIDNQNIIRELAPGVILHKEYIHTTTRQDIVRQFVWKVEVTTMSVVDFDIDLDESENIELNNGIELKTTANIMPFQKKEIALINLKKDWKLKSKFRLTMNVPEKNLQEQFVIKDDKTIEQNRQLCQAKLTSIPLEFYTSSQLEDLMIENSIDQFVDFDFPPNNDSIMNPRYGENMKDVFDYVIHWRRPEDFVLLQTPKQKPNISIFNQGEPEPNDVHQGILPDNHLISAISGLAEKYNLVHRLFKTEETSLHGIYQILLCIKGQWKTIIIDSLFPCIPMINPLVTRSPSNELWVLLLEKAVAKVLDCYFSIIYSTVTDFLLMLTGCPTFYLLIEKNLTFDKKREFVQKLFDYVMEKKYLVIGISHSSDKDEENEFSLTIPNFGYTLLEIKERERNHFLYLRKVWFDPRRDENIQEYQNKMFSTYPFLKQDNTEGILVLTLDEFIKEFDSLSICYSSNWEEARLRGKFVHTKETSLSLYDQCISKWFYQLDLNTSSNIIISLFQDEDKQKGPESKKQIMDISLSVFKYNAKTNQITHLQTLDFSHSPSIQLEINLEPGSYIILPRSSGCFIGKPLDGQSLQTVPLYDKTSKVFNTIFISTIQDIFKKFDLMMNNKLGYNDFKGFYEATRNSTLSMSDFQTNILPLYENFENGMTEKGFIDYWTQNYLESNGDNGIRKWLEALGYDLELFCNQSRSFQLTFHSAKSISVHIKDTINSNINSKINTILLQNFGEGKESLTQLDFTPVILPSKLNNVISIGCINNSKKNQKVKLSFINLNEIILGTQNGIEKIIKEGSTEYFCQFFSLNPENIEKAKIKFEAIPFSG